MAWKHGIRADKFEAARAYLLNSLYFCSPLLFKGMKDIHQQFTLLEEINLSQDFRGLTAHLSQFSSESVRAL
jgi:hypothetical protein